MAQVLSRVVGNWGSH